MHLTVNGKPRDAQSAGTIKEFLEANGVNPVLVAVEHNGEIIKRERFAEVTLADGDNLEIIHMVGGGAA
jgi:thiamine biosynthesis protein ThiS